MLKYTWICIDYVYVYIYRFLLLIEKEYLSNVKVGLGYGLDYKCVTVNIDFLKVYISYFLKSIYVMFCVLSHMRQWMNYSHSLSLSLSLSPSLSPYPVICFTSNVCYWPCFIAVIKPWTPVGIHVQSIHIHVYFNFIRSWKHAMIKVSKIYLYVILFIVKAPQEVLRSSMTGQSAFLY